jgi:hypothetical protein
VQKIWSILNLVVALVASCAWLFPAHQGVLATLSWYFMSDQQRQSHLQMNSFPISMSAAMWASQTFLLLGIAGIYWSLRFSLPLFKMKVK